MIPSRPTPRGPFAVGDVLSGTYRIDGVIGIGAMGAVYDATDLPLRRHVAIKAPLIPALAQGLRAEAQAMAAIRHPAFAEVYALGEHEGTPYLVMERIWGETLAARIEAANGSFDIDEVIDLLVGIADGLAAAHRAGIVHRDLKPANVIVSGDRIVLLDLGLFLPDVLVGPETEAAGSPYWVAPEILLQSAERGKGALADLYSLGAIAYELVTGSRPYEAEYFEQIAAMHVSQPVPDPAAKRPDVPTALAALVRELLAKDPTERPPSAEAVVWQLHAMRNRTTMRARAVRVLVVDDDEHVGKVVQRALKQAYPSLDVRVSTDPKAALPVEDRAPADIVVLDLEMPGTNGIEVCMALRTLPHDRRPAVIVMSGHAGPNDVHVLEALGVERFLPKDEGLLAAVGDAIGRLRWGRPR